MDTKIQSNIINRKVIIAIVIALVAAILILGKSGKYGREKRIAVPGEYVLEQNAEKKYDEKQNLEVARYTTSKSQQELIDYYSQKLQAEGFAIQTNKQINDNAYLIYARKPENRINIFIIKGDEPGKLQVEVTYLPGLGKL